MNGNRDLLFLAAAAAVLYYFWQSNSAAAAPLGSPAAPSPSPSPSPSPTFSPAGTASPAPTMMTDTQPMNAQPVNVSPQGAAFIQQHEGLRLQAYGDAGHQAIGYGHQLAPGESYPGGITQAEARALFEQDLGNVEATLNSAVAVPLTQEQYDALADLVFNIGAPQFLSSTLLVDLNAGDYASAMAQFPAWNRSAGAVSSVLTARRYADAQLFSQGIPA